MAIANNQAMQPAAIFNPAIQILPADTTDLKTLITAGANGALIKEIYITTDDTSDVDVELYLNNGTTDFLMCSYKIPTLSGKSGNLSVKLLSVTNRNEIRLQSTYTLKIKAVATITAAKVVDITAEAYDYVAL